MTSKNLTFPDTDSEWRAKIAGTLLRKLAMHVPLSPAECDRVLDIPVRPRRIAARGALIEERQTPRDICALIEGHAFRYKTLADGSRQILSFHLPGDIVGLSPALLPASDHGISMLTDAVVAQLSHEDVAAAMAEHPGLARAFWRETLIDGSIAREWLLNIGRRDAFTRLAHLFCEMALRCAAAGIGEPSRFEFPVTQNDLADATAMTAVHVNRTLQRLRAEGWVSMQGREVRIENWKALSGAAGFDPTYLHLPPTIIS